MSAGGGASSKLDESKLDEAKAFLTEAISAVEAINAAAPVNSPNAAKLKVVNAIQMISSKISEAKVKLNTAIIEKGVPINTSILPDDVSKSLNPADDLHHMIGFSKLADTSIANNDLSEYFNNIKDACKRAKNAIDELKTLGIQSAAAGGGGGTLNANNTYMNNVLVAISYMTQVADNMVKSAAAAGGATPGSAAPPANANAKTNVNTRLRNKIRNFTTTPKNGKSINSMLDGSARKLDTITKDATAMLQTLTSLINSGTSIDASEVQILSGKLNILRNTVGTKISSSDEQIERLQGIFTTLDSKLKVLAEGGEAAALARREGEIKELLNDLKDEVDKGEYLTYRRYGRMVKFISKLLMVDISEGNQDAINNVIVQKGIIQVVEYTVTDTQDFGGLTKEELQKIYTIQRNLSTIKLSKTVFINTPENRTKIIRFFKALFKKLTGKTNSALPSRPAAGAGGAAAAVPAAGAAGAGAAGAGAVPAAGGGAAAAAGAGGAAAAAAAGGGAGAAAAAGAATPEQLEIIGKLAKLPFSSSSITTEVYNTTKQQLFDLLYSANFQELLKNKAVEQSIIKLRNFITTFAMKNPLLFTITDVKIENNPVTNEVYIATMADITKGFLGTKINTDKKKLIEDFITYLPTIVDAAKPPPLPFNPLGTVTQGGNRTRRRHKTATKKYGKKGKTTLKRKGTKKQKQRR